MNQDSLLCMNYSSLNQLSPLLVKNKIQHDVQSANCLDSNSKLKVQKTEDPNNQDVPSSSKKFTVQGHRGAGDKHNTIFAFKSAIEFNLNCVELDVWQTKDFKLVVIHGEGDDGLIEFEGGKVRIVTLTLEQLQNLYKNKKQEMKLRKKEQSLNDSYDSLQSGETDFSSVKQQDEETDNYENRIPSLEEVLNICKGKINVNIELKGGIDNELFVQQILDLVKQLKVQDEVELSSFDFNYYKIAKQIQKNHDQNIPFGYLVEFTKDIPENMNSEDLAGNSINFPPSFLDCAETVEKLQKMNQEQSVNLTCYFNYDNNEFDEVYDRLREIGVNTIITNQPAVINEYRKKRTI